MGACFPCLNAESGDLDVPLNAESGDFDEPSPETRRHQIAEAAEKRQKENEGRGIKDPGALKRKRKRKEALEKKADALDKGVVLRWQVG